MSTVKLSQFDTALTADTVEWCPAVYGENVAACGTYQLDAETGRRHGSLSLHKHMCARNSQGDNCTKLLQNKVLEYGILDMKWAVHSTKTLLALAASSGDVVFITFNLQDTTAVIATKPILELMNLLHRNKFLPWEDFFVGSDVISPNQLRIMRSVVHLKSWEGCQLVPEMRTRDSASLWTGVWTQGASVIVAVPDPHICSHSLLMGEHAQRRVLAVSDSLGVVSIVDYDGGGGGGGGGWGGGRLRQSWHAHEFEAWIVCLGQQSHCVYSGGDDCRLCVWDTRGELEKPAMTSREHTMGVCSLQVHPFREHLLASGSYDERVLLWDVRSLRRPVKETAVGGGVWRVKWHPMNSDFMATACMHNGFQIINWHLNDAEPAEVVCTYSDHSSLAYGIDWSRVQTDDSTHLLASCSFYDHALHFWTAHL